MTTELVMPWGRHIGKVLSDLPSSYLGWLAEECHDEDICEAADEEYQWRTDHSAHFE